MSSPLLYRREGRRLQDCIGDRGDDLTVLFGLRASTDPFRIGLEPGEPLRPIIEGFPFEHVIKVLVRRPDRHGPEPGLLDAVLLPEGQGERVEPLYEIGKAAGYAVINPQFVDHILSFFGCWSLEKAQRNRASTQAAASSSASSRKRAPTS